MDSFISLAVALCADGCPECERYWRGTCLIERPQERSKRLRPICEKLRATLPDDAFWTEIVVPIAQRGV
jgi:hypothetical protein